MRADAMKNLCMAAVAALLTACASQPERAPDVSPAAIDAQARQQALLDSALAKDVRQRLEASREVNGWNLKVEVYQGNVTLSGSANNPKEKAAAERIASEVQGAKAVFNQIVVKN
jgi:osmotically-inducible protein OsmY